VNVRELVNVIKFKTDTASLKAAETAVNRIKQTMQKTKPLDLKVNSGNAQRSINNLQAKLNQLQRQRQLRLNADTSGIDKMISKLKELERQQVRNAQAGAKGRTKGALQGGQPSGGGGMSSMLGGLKGAFVALGGMAIVSEIKETADAMMSLDSRIKIVTKDDAERLKVESALYSMSQKNRASLEDMGDLYYKTAMSAKRFGASQEDVLRLTDIVSKSLVIGGADTAQQKATILQLSQALGSGVLQGDELRSLRENAPKLMDAIATYFNTDVGGLKQMGAKGELTTEKLMQAILASGQAIDKEFTQITPTIGQALTVLGNKWSKFIMDVQNSTGIFGSIAGVILQAVDWIGEAIDFVAKEFGTATPEMISLIENFKSLWESLQPLITAVGTIFINWIVPALKTFGRVSAAVLDMVVTLLKPIVDLLTSIANLIATASGGFSSLISKAESGAIERYNSIMVNQNNNITVPNGREAGEAAANAMPMEFPIVE